MGSSEEVNRRGEAAREIARPQAGFFQIRLVRKGPFVPSRIFVSDGLWGVIINGDECGNRVEDPILNYHISRVWEHGVRIEEVEYDNLLLIALWAPENAPDRPEAKPNEPIILSEMRSIF